MKEIRAFAAILQTPERVSKPSHRLCTAEVRGSTPLGSTLESAHTAGFHAKPSFQRIQLNTTLGVAVGVKWGSASGVAVAIGSWAVGSVL
jgi:hypothetical protein